MTQETTSLNKFISSKGLCSRREADKWIEKGRVRINGRVAKKGNRVGLRDRVTIDGRVIQNESETVYIMLNKPPGVTSTTDKKDKSNITDYINYPHRIFPIGRLDKNSTGLILLTNDGDVVNRILRKENKHEKEYIVRVDQNITDSFISKMSGPIPILGTKTLPSRVRKINNNVFNIILTQGLNRQIRRMTEYCGYKVLALKRIRIMHLKLGKLSEGDWRFLTKEEISILHKSLK